MEWSRTWQLPFNKHLHVGRGMNSQTYHMNDHVLENITEEKDLGVIVDDKLKFHMHTLAAIKKQILLGLIKRSFSVNDKIMLGRERAKMCFVILNRLCLIRIYPPPPLSLPTYYQTYDFSWSI